AIRPAEAVRLRCDPQDGPRVLRNERRDSIPEIATVKKRPLPAHPGRVIYKRVRVDALPDSDLDCVELGLAADVDEVGEQQVEQGRVLRPPALETRRDDEACDLRE